MSNMAFEYALKYIHNPYDILLEQINQKQRKIMLNLYSIKDAKTGGFTPPIASAHVQDVIRAFKRRLTDKQKGDNYAEFPEDYSIWEVGTFDTETGVTNPLQNPKHVVSLISLTNLEG